MARKAGTAHRVQRRGKIRTALALATFLPQVFFCLVSLTVCYSAFATERWTGVDESVVEKFASEQGREAHGPLINTDQGDLLLFVFLLAGAVGGFAAGYSWRMLVEGKAKGSESTGKKCK